MKPLNVTIRTSQSDDYDVVSELSYTHMTPEEKRAYLEVNPKAAERFRNQIMGGEGICFVAEMNNVCVGYLVGGIKSTPLTTVKFVELETIAIKSKYRNHGIGSLLAKRFLLWSEEIGADRVSVVASPRNAAAIRFYERLGFTASSLELEIVL